MAEDLSIKDFESFAHYKRIEIDDSFNELSLLIARKFDDGEMSYEDGDFAMNGIWPIMLDYIIAKDIPLVEPCYEIYCAFDAGEYEHLDGADSGVKYTQAAIKRILKNA